MSQSEVLTLIAEQSGGEIVAHLNSACPLESLNLDSLEYLDLIVKLENATGISVEPPSRIAEFSTVGDLVETFAC